ncbi:MAG TPA: magnesium-translocating P-type ATPase, partial [Actinomycetes bacterium]
MTTRASATVPVPAVLDALGSSPAGLTREEVLRRRAVVGRNAVRSHRARWTTTLARQVRSPLLLLLAVTAAASFFLGERVDALVIGIILVASVGLGFVNEFRAERTAESLHSQLRHTCVAWREGHPSQVDVTELVPGDVVELQPGEVVPADLRLLDTSGLECDESILTGESMPVPKGAAPVPAGTSPAELTCCAFMGTVVHVGEGRGVVVATGARAEFGRIAAELGEQHPETEFQLGLRRFTVLLVRVAAVLTAGIFVINLVLDRPLLDALLFSLAIAVGISPQLLPAVVSTSLATGSRQLARDKVLVKRLVCIEDLGDLDVLFTDKTGTLTEGRLRFMRSMDAAGVVSDGPVTLGLLCTEAVVEDGQAVGGNPLDVALWNSPGTAAARAHVEGYRRLDLVPFDHDRRLVSVLVSDRTGALMVITKGAPEAVLDRCLDVPTAARRALDAEFAAGNRVVAVATRSAPGQATLTTADEHGLQLRGLLVFLDPPKATAAPALARLAALGVRVKVLTGDNPAVAASVCHELGLPPGRVLSGADVESADDARLAELIGQATVFARVSPQHKARIVRAQRQAGAGVGFLGDGVNDAVALHDADVGISVDTATDVAKDAADVILLEKDLGVLADGVVGGRRIFANTIKYALMGTSSNFGNMFSAAGASAFLSFLPMLPSQILLNNLLYDTSQLAIPTDNVDPEQLARPSRWDVDFIRRFMLVFGPVSSLFDFATFAVMLWIFDAGASLFQSGWFVESLATQTLVIFAIRTRRIPFLRSHPSVTLLVAALGVVSIGGVLPATPVAESLGFTPLPAAFYLALVLMVVGYLVVIEVTKSRFFRAPAAPHVPRRRP